MNAARVIADLRQLDARSGGQRVAWTDVWTAERGRLRASVARELPHARIDRDEAGNLWMELPGERPGKIIVGSHLDCVPGGGWLDGCLGVLAAVECARQLATEPASHRKTLAVVDWADEEGARSGHSLLGSSAASGRLDIQHLLSLTTTDGLPVAELLRRCDVEPHHMTDARSRLRDANAYVELHIEQGPVLETMGRATAAVSGCLGARRLSMRFTGQAAHAGATPMGMRRDPTLPTARFLLGARDIAIAHNGLATVGVIKALPGTPTAIPEAVEIVLDLRHRDRDALQQLDMEMTALAERAAKETGCATALKHLWSIDPVAFDIHLLARAAALTGGEPIISGPLHDAVAIASAGVPTAMLFVRTRGGISHSREEDASDDDLTTALAAFGKLVTELVLHPASSLSDE